MFASYGKDAMKPLIFPIIAAATPDDINIEFYDDRIEPLPANIDADIIAFSTETFAAKRAYELCSKYKNENNITVIGGFHPTCVPDEAEKYCDIVIIGDAEDTWGSFINDYKNNSLKKRYISNSNFVLQYLNYNHICFSNKKYLPIGTVFFSRGCKFNCDFCSIKAVYPNKILQKDKYIIQQELKEIKEKVIFFIDDNIFSDKNSLMEFLDIIKPLNKRWACQISIDIAMQDDLLSIMKESGCFLVLIGFESLNIDNLKEMNKKANINIENYHKAVKNIYKHKLMIYATFIFGYDYDKFDDIDTLVEFAVKHNFAVANFNPLLPMPNTKLYKRLESQGRLLYDKWWLQEGLCYGETVFKPSMMTPKELEQACKKARYSFYSIKNILKRFIFNASNHSIKNAFVYLAANIVSRIEIHKKQNREFGR